MTKNMDKLMDSITTICEITCFKCNIEIKRINIDDYNFAEDLDAEGWKVDCNFNVHCPKCSKKKRAVKLKISTSRKNIS